VTVLVYTKPGCVQCEHTEKQLVKLEIPHQMIDVTVDKDAEAKVLATGNLQMPMVVAGTDVWHGFKIDKLRGLKARYS
jgi:glutaredoxin-like protein NrdH